MALLCRLGLHRPGPDETWNKGWYFTSCDRCGADLIRTGSGKWRVPKGRKVVWKPRTPRGRKPGEPGADQGPVAPASSPSGPAASISSDQPGGR